MWDGKMKETRGQYYDKVAEGLKLSDNEKDFVNKNMVSN